MFLNLFYDEIEEIGFIKKHNNINNFDNKSNKFDNKKYSDFSDINLMKLNIPKYSKLLLDLDPEDPTFEARKYSLKNRKEQDLDAVSSMNEHRKKIGKKRTYNNIKDKIENVLKSKTTKILIDFSD